MPLLAGFLFAVGIAGLLFAVVASLPGAPFHPLIGPASSGVGLIGMGASWLALLWRNARLEQALDETTARVMSGADDLRRARMALGDAEHSIQTAALGTELAPLFKEMLEEAKATGGDPDRLYALLAALRGLTTANAPAPTALHDLLDDAANRSEALTHHALRIDKVVESAGTISVDRERVIGLLVQVLAASHEASPVEGRPIRVEVTEWQAGLLRLVVTAPDARPMGTGARHAGLLLASAQARAMGGSLAWHDGTHGERRFLLLLPLEEEDYPTDPGGRSIPPQSQ